MSLACPRTHFDKVAEEQPDFVKMTCSAAEKIPEGDFAFTAKDFNSDDLIEFAKNKITSEYRAHLHKQGYRGEVRYEDAYRANPEYVQAITLQWEKEFYAIGNYHSHGRKTMFFAENLVEKLADTELNVDCELMKPSFPACMFVYDDQITRDAIYAVSGGKAPATGAVTSYVMNYKTDEGMEGLAVYAVHPGQGGSPGVAIMRHLAMVEGSDVETALRTDWKKIDGGKGYRENESGDDSMFFTGGMQFMRIVTNSVLYLASSNPDIVPGLRDAPLIKGREPNKYEKRIYEKKLTSAAFTVVGSTFLPYAVLTDSEGRKLDHQVKVRGHHKMQAYGPGLMERRRILIQPYWKGPDAAEILNKPFSIR
jgi:hypothetical protein